MSNVLVLLAPPVLTAERLWDELQLRRRFQTIGLISKGHFYVTVHMMHSNRNCINMSVEQLPAELFQLSPNQSLVRAQWDRSLGAKHCTPCPECHRCVTAVGTKVITHAQIDLQILMGAVKRRAPFPCVCQGSCIPRMSDPSCTSTLTLKVETIILCNLSLKANIS